MKHRLYYALFALVVVSSLVLAGCKPATQTPAPAAEATQPPPSPGFEPMSLEAPSCDYGGEFKKIEALDEKTVKFTLCYPDADFASKVAFSVFSITSKEFLDANTGDSVKMSEKPVGTGPYKLKEWVRGDRVLFEANPDYWGEKAFAQNLIFRWSEQSAQRLLELQSGQVDGIDNPAPEDFEAIDADANLALYPRGPLNIFYIGFQVDIPPFDNVLVRKAIAHAIDRQRIIDQYYPEGSVLAKVFVPPAIQPGYNDAAEWYPFDQAKAKELLAEAGYADGLNITLSFRNVVRAYLATPDKVAQEIQAQLAEVGVNVELKQMESTAFIDATSAGQEGFYLLGWNADYPGATNFYDYHFATAENKQFGTLFPDIVEPIRAAGKIADPAERQKLYDTVNDLLKEYVPMIPVAHGASATAFKASVKGAHASPLGNEVFSVMDPGADTLVWMQNGEPAALWCSDETDGETLRACEQVYEALLAFKVGSTEVVPALAESWEPNADATEWVFTLRDGVRFHDGSTLDANDVVATYISYWDASSPNHVGRTGSFEYFGAFFAKPLNAE
jgi:ABC-type transport system substrate-binding protein